MNMGIGKMIVVGNRDLDDEAVRQMATHVAEGDRRRDPPLRHPRRGAGGVLLGRRDDGAAGVGPGARRLPAPDGRDLVGLSQENEIALLFGPEDTGLTNDDLRFCQTWSTIPTAGFKSLNLSHAVMVVCYELFVARMEEDGEASRRSSPASKELEGMYAQLKETLLAIGFLQPGESRLLDDAPPPPLFPDDPPGPGGQDLRGICRQIEWYGDHKERKNS